MSSQVWGGRFVKPRNPLLIEFDESLSIDHQLYQYDIVGSIAHSKMLAKQGLISEEENKLINKALEEILKDFDDQKIELDKTHEDIHMLVEYHLIKKIGDVGKKLHTGRSRNDQVQLDVRLYMRDIGAEIIGLLDKFTKDLGELRDQHIDVKIPGYTHLQQAQPICLGNYHEAYMHMFQRDTERFKDCLKRLNYSPLGAAALAGSNLPLDRQFVADLLHFDGIITNTIDAVSDRDYIIEFLSACSIVMVHLSRLCEEIIIWSTVEFNFITLDDSFATGSSIMPNKKNPDVAELIKGKSGRVIANLMGMLTILKGLPLAYGKDLQEDKEFLFDSVKTIKSCLGIIGPYLKSMTYNKDVMENAVNSGFLGATKMMENLILKGIPFRDAHHAIGKLVQTSIETGIPLEEIWKKSKLRD